MTHLFSTPEEFGVKETLYDFYFLKDNPYVGIIDLMAKQYDERSPNAVKTDDGNFWDKWVRKYIWTPTITKCEQDDGPLATLLALREQTTSYEEWKNITEQLDEMAGNEAWKNDPVSDLFDYELVQDQLNSLRLARKDKDYHKLVYIMRTGWARNFAGINNVHLYDHCYRGTKHLIEEYLNECAQCLAELTAPECPLDDKYLLEMMVQTRKSYGCMAMTMSGGGTFGLTGIGVFAALFEENIFPKIVSGSSCGSIMSAIVSSKLDSEILEILAKLYEFHFEVFTSDEKPESAWANLARFLKYGVCFDNKLLKNTIQDLLGDITFKEAYNKTGRVLNITISSASVHEQPTLLNYLTAPNVLIWSAICASCSLPFVFPASDIYEKDGRTGQIKQWSNPMVKFVDGSVNGDLPITRLSEMFNVNYFVACQANPHVLPLVKLSMECDNEETNSPVSLFFRRLLRRSFKVASYEVSHYLDVCNEIGLFSNACTKIKQLIQQPYRGNVTILPDIKMRDLSVLFANPTAQFLKDCIIWGAKATWPRLQMIKDHCAIEFALDKHIAIMRSRMIANNTLEPITKPATLLSCQPLLKQHESPRANREKHFRHRSETFSCIHLPNRPDVNGSPRHPRRVSSQRGLSSRYSTTSLKTIRYAENASFTTSDYSEKRRTSVSSLSYDPIDY